MCLSIFEWKIYKKEKKQKIPGEYIHQKVELTIWWVNEWKTDYIFQQKNNEYKVQISGIILEW